MHIPRSVIKRLKSILGLLTQEEIDEWHQFCAAQTDPAIKIELSIQWPVVGYRFHFQIGIPRNSRIHGFCLPSINSFRALQVLIGISHQSNYVETAHAGRNAETSTGVGLLTAILQSEEHDNIRTTELAQIERDGVMRHRWNGSSEREKLSAQRKISKMRKGAVRNDQLTSYDTLKAERDTGSAENQASLERQRRIESQIKSLQAEMKIDKHRTDLQESINELRSDVDEEKALRREWLVRRAVIDAELTQLRKGPLAGARIKGRRPTERPSGEDESDVAHDDIFSIDLALFEQSIFTDQPNLGTDPNFNMEHFLEICDPLTLDFRTTLGPTSISDFSVHGVGAVEGNTGLDADELEYFGEPAAYYYSGPAPQEQVVIYEGNNSNLGSSRTSDQELPPLPPPPPSFPASVADDEEEEQPLVAVAADSESPIAIHDIDLELSDRNVLAGKWSCTNSSSAIDAAAMRPVKKIHVMNKRRGIAVHGFGSNHG
ncbi:hypothetical protein C8R44DRAFT_731625 [Mycena epipterygia]|nr:hypothetical protein C8R44DRAFT_731625 [Mycena epipterygia]